MLLHLKLTGALSLDVELSEDEKFGTVKQLICSKTSLPPNGFKVLAKGKFLKDDNATLKELKLTDNIKLLVMKSNEQTSKEEEEKKTASVSRFARLSEAVKEISKRTSTNSGDNGDYYFELENQQGQKLDVPEKDRQLLTQGIALHEKGKALLKREQLNEALEVLLLADESFELCDPKFTSMIDNPAYLAMDIVWTMFLMKDLNRLRDARDLLKKAELGFRKAHGPNLERLRQLRDGFIPERALYVRLHLLQAVIAFHMGLSIDAKRYLDQAREESAALRINDEDLGYLLSLDFSAKEATRALRACHNNKIAAETYIAAKRHEAEELRRKRQQEAADRRKARKYGLTQNGKSIQMPLLRALQNMGYPEELAAEALKQCNNDQHETLSLLMDPMKRTILETSLFTQVVERERQTSAPEASRNLDSDIAQLVGMGFDDLAARTALLQSGGDIQAAANICMNNVNINDDVSTLPIPEVYRTNSQSSDAPSTSEEDSEDSSAPSDSKEAEETRRIREEEEAKKRQLDEDIANELMPDMEEDPEAYLDIDLTQETSFIDEYAALMQQREQPQK